MKQKGVYRHRWAGESRDQRTHDFMDEVKIALDWTTGVCSQSSHPSAVSEAKQKGLRTQSYRGGKEKWEQEGLLGHPIKNKAGTSIPPIGQEDREARHSYISQGEVLRLTAFLA